MTLLELLAGDKMKITKQHLRRIIREAEGSTKKYDDDSALKGGQSKLPDELQRSIIDKTVEDREEHEEEEREEKNESFKVTKRQLRRIIREEKYKILAERKVRHIVRRKLMEQPGMPPLQLTLGSSGDSPSLTHPEADDISILDYESSEELMAAVAKMLGPYDPGSKVVDEEGLGVGNITLDKVYDTIMGMM
jgi:hypothetical protein